MIAGAMTFLQKHAAKGQIVTGLLYVRSGSRGSATPTSTPWDTPLNRSRRMRCARLRTWTRSTPACARAFSVSIEIETGL